MKFILLFLILLIFADQFLIYFYGEVSIESSKYLKIGFISSISAFVLASILNLIAIIRVD
jgi:hypothetical protein